LVRREKRDDDLSPVAAALASKPVSDLSQRVIIAEVCPQFG
jgi:hypothetical protein